MVLGVMVCILVYRVYTVLNPPPPPAGPILGRPGTDPPTDIPVPPLPPRDPETDDWSRLWRFSPFIYIPPRAGSNANNPNDNVDSTVQLTLEQIKPVGDGTYRAKIRT